MVTATLLTGCGGGTGGTVVTPAPTPTPTPAPTSAPATGEIKPGANSEIIATTQLLTLNAAGNATSDRSVLLPNPAIRISYDVAARTYTLTNDLGVRQFGPSQFVRETAVPDYFPRVEFESRTANEANFLLLFKQANATPAIPLSRVGYGAWQQNTPGTSAATRIRLDYFAYGDATPVSAMPTSGTVVYRVSGTGNYAADNELKFAQSYATISVDFGAGVVRTSSILLSGADFITGNSGGLISFTIAGPITGNTSSGSATYTVATWSGIYKLQFFGPNANEIGIIFAGQGLNGTLNGALVGVTP
jgi:hypothetical protein